MNPNDLTTRRDFLNNGLTLVGAAATVPAFLTRTAETMAADPGSKSGKGDHPILVVVQMAGGNDGLNTIVPVRNDLYYKNRPNLAIAKDDTLPLTDELGLNPAAEGFKALYDEGLLSIVQGIGYPNHNRSHFKSMDIWHKASPEERLHNGWLGRYFDNTCKGADPDPKDGIALMNESPLAMQGDKFAPLAFNRPDQLRWRAGKKAPGDVAQAAFDTINTAKATPPNADDELMFLTRSAMDARVSGTEIQSIAKGKSAGDYPAFGFAQSLKLVSQMIAADMPTRVYYVTLGGFDTHAGQAGRHENLMRQLTGSLSAFVGDLKAQGNFDRTLIVSFSEFGRRVKQNASAGTDHGEAAPLFVIGSKVKPGFVGDHPSLEEDKLHRGDLAFQIDFRTVYAAVLKNWMHVDPTSILAGNFKPADILKT
jgi:uncharacterized protein (DUF1501 family)